MALASEAIATAFRELNLLAAGQPPTSAEQAEALVLLNGLLAATPGYGAGQELTDLNIGGEWDQSACVSDYLPENVRLALDLAGASTFKLHPKPYDGQRLAVADATGTLSVNPLTLDGNGRRIEGAATLTLDTDGEVRQWLYRADLGQWLKLTPLLESDDLPFPAEFDQYFVLLLALRLGPRYGVALTAASTAWLDTLGAQMEARYRRPRDPVDWPSPALLGRDTPPHGGSWGYGSYPGAFDRGRGW